jgi:hypothetical protein
LGPARPGLTVAGPVRRPLKADWRIQVPPEEPFFQREKLSFFVYVIHSKISNKTYIGQTDNLKKRILQHNDPENKFSYFTKRYNDPENLGSPRGSSGHFRSCRHRALSIKTFSVF